VRTLGPEIASKDLYDILDLYLKDLDDVKIEVLQHLSEFMISFNEERQVSFLSTLPFVLKNSMSNWRHREILARYEYIYVFI
jgi:hypothetical protein